MKARTFPSLLPVLIALATGASIQGCGAKGPSVELAGHHYGVEIADTEPAREHGLMDRTKMAADHGMLFEFQDEIPRAFWMKNTKIPLDMLFFNGDRRLLSVQHDVQPCTADPCPAYSSGAPARYVLELNAGEARRIGAAPGDEMQIAR